MNNHGIIQNMFDILSTGFRLESHHVKRFSVYMVIIVVFLQSCITIKESSFRTDAPKKIEVEKCKISSTGEVYINLFGILKADFVPSGIKIEYDTLIIFFDPVVVNDTVKADYIFITHNHLDHFSKPDIQKLSKPETVITGPVTVTKKLKKNTCKTVSAGDTIDYGSIKCEVMNAYNIYSNAHKKSDKFLGYVISCDNIRIYVAGDTDFIPEMKQLKNITVSIIPMGAGKTAMDPYWAAEAANLIKPKVVIPYHYEIGKDNEATIQKLVNKKIRISFLR